MWLVPWCCLSVQVRNSGKCRNIVNSSHKAAVFTNSFGTHSSSRSTLCTEYFTKWTVQTYHNQTHTIFSHLWGALQVARMYTGLESHLDLLDMTISVQIQSRLDLKSPTGKPSTAVLVTKYASSIACERLENCFLNSICTHHTAHIPWNYPTWRSIKPPLWHLQRRYLDMSVHVPPYFLSSKDPFKSVEQSSRKNGSNIRAKIEICLW